LAENSLHFRQARNKLGRIMLSSGEPDRQTQATFGVHLAYILKVPWDPNFPFSSKRPREFKYVYSRYIYVSPSGQTKEQSSPLQNTFCQSSETKKYVYFPWEKHQAHQRVLWAAPRCELSSDAGKGFPPPRLANTLKAAKMAWVPET